MPIMSGMKVLDLFCCSGGATRGYQRAGATVTGVDSVIRPRYCGDRFIKGDAIEWLCAIGREFDLIHASPPCQAGCTLTNGTNASRGWGGDHDQLVPITRYHLDKIGVPYVIEQPTGHGGLIRTDVRLCMDMFPIGEPPWVQRHRDFEISGFAAVQPSHPGPWNRHNGRVRGYRHGVYSEGPYVAAYGRGGDKATVAEMQHALDIDWTDEREELTEAIPPAYTEYLGRHFQFAYRLSRIGKEVRHGGESAPVCGRCGGPHVTGMCL